MLKDIPNKYLIFIIAILLFSFSFLSSFSYFIDSYPNKYAWGELFIKYTDGFIRRGLLGSILFATSNFVSVCFVWSTSIFIIYTVFFKKVYTLFNNNISYFFTIILFFSPSMLSFSVRDRDLFGRKDVLILLLLFIAMSLCTKIIKSQQASPYIWLKIAACYSFSFLVHEITLFFSLLPALLAVIASDKNKLRTSIAIFIIFCASAYFAIHYQGTEAIRDAMVADWRTVIDSFSDLGGMQFIGSSLAQNIDTSSNWLKSYPVMKSYALAWILTLTPIALFLYIYRFHSINVSVAGKFFAWCSYLCALFPAVTLTFLINDFGRIISYSSLLFVTYAVFIIEIYKSKHKDIQARNIINFFDFSNRYVFIASILYITCWKLHHWTNINGSLISWF